MLTATKQCLESLKNGVAQGPSCTEARGYVKSLAQAAAAADRLNSGTRSVDDELSDMDKAIEQAAKQIEVCHKNVLRYKLVILVVGSY